MTAPTLDITRDNETFAVLDDPETRFLNFWDQQYAPGIWEPATLAAIDRFLDGGGDYLDIGAWVGPTVLWAARKADHVIALEPDPVAIGILLANVGMNVNNVTLWPAAVTNGIDGSVRLRSWRWGNSTSTTAPQERIFPWIVRHQPDAHQLDEVDVPAVDLADVIGRSGDDLRLAKIDIEGGEADLVHRLGEFHCPVILSLHWPWMADRQTVHADLIALPGRLTWLDENPDFPVVLYEP